jgi:hypothetical protein
LAKEIDELAAKQKEGTRRMRGRCQEVTGAVPLAAQGVRGAHGAGFPTP